MFRYLPLLVVALGVAACDPAARCANGIESANAALDKVRSEKAGLSKLAPPLLKASASLAAAEVSRVGKDYEACMADIAKAEDYIDKAKK